MQFTIFASLALSVLAAAPPTPPVAVMPLPPNLQTCTVRNSQVLTGSTFIGHTFKPSNNQILLQGTIKDVTFSLKSKYTPNTPAGKFAPNNFILELKKGKNVDTLEAYTDSTDPTKVVISSLTVNPDGTAASSTLFSRGPGPQSLKMFGLIVNWSVEKTAKGQVTKFQVNNQVGVTLNQLTGSIEPQIVIQRPTTVVISGGVCNQ